MQLIIEDHMAYYWPYEKKNVYSQKNQVANESESQSLGGDRERYLIQTFQGQRHQQTGSRIS